MIIKAPLVSCFLAAFTLLAAPSVSATLVSIVSGDGTETCAFVVGTGTCTVQTISPASVWQPNNPGGSDAVWISYADTGRPGTVGAPPGLVATFQEVLFANIGDSLNLKVWADDTAAVTIDGITVFEANFDIDTACAAGPIGCESDEPGIISHIFASAGLHTLLFKPYQSGGLEPPPGNPFGLLYSGELSVTSSIPTPATLPLFLSALAILGFVGWRRTHS